MSAAAELERPLVKIPHPYSRAEMDACEAPRLLEVRRRFRTHIAEIKVYDEPEFDGPVAVGLFFNIDPPAWASTTELRAKWATKLVKRAVEGALDHQVKATRPTRCARAVAALAAFNAVVASKQLVVGGSGPLRHRYGSDRRVVIHIVLNTGTPRPELIAAREASRAKADRLHAEGFTW